MLAKHFKDLLKNVPDNMLILFDDGAGVFQPISSSIQMKVVTFDDPGDPNPEFFDANEWQTEKDELEDVEGAFGVPDEFEAIVFSTEIVENSYSGS